MSVPLYSRVNSKPVLEPGNVIMAQVRHMSRPSLVVSRNPLDKLRKGRVNL